MKIDRNNISTRIEAFKHVGKIYCNRSNFLFKVLGYDNTAHRYIVTFDLDMTLDTLNEDYATLAKTSTINEGSIKERFPPNYDKSRNKSVRIYDEVSIRAICRRTWRSLTRRNVFEGQKKYYGSVTICDEWLKSRDAFVKWYLDEMPVKGVFTPHMYIDKDALQWKKAREDKVYSPETCILLTASLNQLLILPKNDDKECPLGVSQNKWKTETTYRVYCQGVSPKCCSSRSFKTKLEAFIFYKMLKEYKIKEEATKAYTASKINQRAYESLLKFEVLDNNGVILDMDVKKWLYKKYGHPTKYVPYTELREQYFQEYNIKKVIHISNTIYKYD